MSICTEQLKAKRPQDYKTKKPTKRLAAIEALVFDIIPLDPSRDEYRQGQTQGPYKHWFGAKFFQQYLLFFRYHAASKIIVYTWVNDEDSLRAYGSGDDAYRVFGKMLIAGNPPDDWGGVGWGVGVKGRSRNLRITFLQLGLMLKTPFKFRFHLST